MEGIMSLNEDANIGRSRDDNVDKSSEKDSAFEWLQKAYEERSNWLLYLKAIDILESEYNSIVVVVKFSKMEDEQGRSVSNNFVLTAYPVFIYGKV
jgi:hypothetical protein